MENYPLVSIIMPVYNCEKFINFAIYSILNQSYSNWELLIINDGSNDLTEFIIKSHSDRRINFIDSQENKGLANRLNEAIILSKGKLIARMDADDVMHPQRLEKQVNFFLANPNVDVLGTRVIIIDNDNKIIGERGGTQIPSNYFNLLKNGCFIHPTVMAKNVFFYENRYNESNKRAEDLELWGRTFLQYNFVILEECLLFYREAGVFSLKKYLNSVKDYKQYILKSSFIKISKKQRILLLLTVNIKTLIFLILDTFNLANWATKTRSKRIGAEYKLKLERLLISIIVKKNV